MTRLRRSILVLSALALPATAFAGHSNLEVPPADTFLLGGDQIAAMEVRGKNTGQTSVAILARASRAETGPAETDPAETPIATVAPGASFKHTFAPGETALIRNLSTSDTARLSVDFTGSPESLSMRYALPQE